MFKEFAAELEYAFRLDGDTRDANVIAESYKRGGQRAVQEASIQINASPKWYDPASVAASYCLLGCLAGEGIRVTFTSSSLSQSRPPA
jgi:hypothetical protein